MTETLSEAVARLAGMPSSATDSAERPVDAADQGTGADLTPSAAWPAAALELLEEAESRAREGDWQGFGNALDELRALLETLQRQGG
jgi:hypothetical protein